MKRPLTAADLSDNVYCELGVGLTKIAFWESDEQFPPAIEKATKDVALLAPSEIKREFDVTDEVAEKLAGFQADILKHFHEAVQRMVERSGRYLEVKQYLDNSRYTDYIMHEFIDENPTAESLD